MRQRRVAIEDQGHSGLIHVRDLPNLSSSSPGQPIERGENSRASKSTSQLSVLGQVAVSFLGTVVA